MNRLQLLRNTIPSLFTHPGTLLYVGISKGRAHCLQELYDAGHTITALEISEENVHYYQSDERLINIIHGDVREIDKLFTDPFNVIFWWHGPEHIEKHEIAFTVEKLEHLATRHVLLSGPWGRSRSKGHLCHLYPDDFTTLGYKVVTGGRKHGQSKSALIAWKLTS